MAQAKIRAIKISFVFIFLSALCGSVAAFSTMRMSVNAQKFAASTTGPFLDEDAQLAASTFPIKPDALIQKAKEVIERGVGTKNSESDLADDFTFAGPVVGPLSKKEYLGALASFRLEDAFPDLNPHFHHFRVDPFETNRVWFTSAGTATFTGELPAFKVKGKGQKVEMAHQTNSLTFNEDGKVKHYTIGYVMDRALGNTGGLGGVYGILYAVGSPLPFPEARPWKKSYRYRAFQFFGSMAQKLQGKKQQKQKDAAKDEH